MSEHRDKAVAAGRVALQEAAAQRPEPWARVVIAATESHLERMVIEQLARRGGDLPNVLCNLPEMFHEVVRAALAATEENAVERFKEAALSNAAKEAAAVRRYEDEENRAWSKADGWEQSVARRAAREDLEAALSKARELMEEGG